MERSRNDTEHTGTQMGIQPCRRPYIAYMVELRSPTPSPPCVMQNPTSKRKLISLSATLTVLFIIILFGIILSVSYEFVSVYPNIHPKPSCRKYTLSHIQVQIRWTTSFIPDGRNLAAGHRNAIMHIYPIRGDSESMRYLCMSQSPSHKPLQPVSL